MRSAREATAYRSKRFIRGDKLITYLAGILFLTISGHASAASLAVQPLRQDIQLPPGQTAARQLIVSNTGKTSEAVHVYASAFSVNDPQYDYSFDRNKEDAKWVQFQETSVQLAPSQQHTFRYTLAVPDTAEPGGKYIAIFASISSPAANNQQTTIEQRTGSLIYLTVSGNVTKQGRLLAVTIPRLTFNQRLPWNIRIQNSGNTHFTSTLSTQISVWPGKAVASAAEDHLILPGTIRALNGHYRLGTWPGLYTVHLKVALGNSSATKTIRLVYLPPLYTAVELAAVLLLLAIIITVQRRLARKHR